MLSGLSAFVQTTLLIKTVQLCSELIFAEGRGGGGVRRNTEYKRHHINQAQQVKKAECKKCNTSLKVRMHTYITPSID